MISLRALSRSEGSRVLSTKEVFGCPLLVSWPGKIKPGSESARTIGAEDCLPTILELLGIGKRFREKWTVLVLRLHSLGKKQSARSFLYREFSGYGGQQAVWTGKWKGIRQKILRKRKTS